MSHVWFKHRGGTEWTKFGNELCRWRVDFSWFLLQLLNRHSVISLPSCNNLGIILTKDFQIFIIFWPLYLSSICSYLSNNLRIISVKHQTFFKFLQLFWLSLFRLFLPCAFEIVILYDFQVIIFEVCRWRRVEYYSFVLSPVIWHCVLMLDYRCVWNSNGQVSLVHSSELLWTQRKKPDDTI